MPFYAFAFGEASIQISADGMALLSASYATSLSISESPVALEDGSIAFKRTRWSLESPWVDDEFRTIRRTPGPFDVVVTWVNEDDLRLRSEAITKATPTEFTLRGSLDAGAQIYSIQFEALTR